MALPARQALGTPDGGTAPPTLAWPTHLADDIGILMIMSTPGALGLTTNAADWTAVANSPQTTGAGGTGVALHVFWSRATSGAMGGVSWNDLGDSRGQIVTVRGCVASGNPVNISAGDVEASGSTSVTIPGATTTKTDCLVMAIVANSTDLATDETSNWANASLASFSEWDDFNTASGNGGGIGHATGELAAGGAYSATTADLVTSSLQARISLALMSTTSADVGGGGGGGFRSRIAGGLVMS